MKDVRHKPVFDESESKFVCEQCGITIPPEPCLAAPESEVISIGGTDEFIPSLGNEAQEAVKCSSAVARAQEGQAAHVKEAVLRGVEVQAGDELVNLPSISEVEKQSTRQSLSAFLAMREMTRPEETKSS